MHVVRAREVLLDPRPPAAAPLRVDVLVAVHFDAGVVPGGHAPPGPMEGRRERVSRKGSWSALGLS